MQRKRKYLIVAAAFVLFWFSIFGIPLIFSVATGVPYWFLSLNIRALSLNPPQSMSIEVSPTVPTNLGEIITVRVVDSQNGTALEGASVKTVKDGLSMNRTTDSYGIATFEYMGGYYYNISVKRWLF
jgi:hypothetical protein